MINIDKIDDTESKELLQRSLQNKQFINDNGGTTKLLELFVNLPLAIIQVAVYLNTKGGTIAKYLRIYEDSSNNVIRLLSKDFKDIRRHCDGPGQMSPDESLRHLTTSGWTYISAPSPLLFLP